MKHTMIPTYIINVKERHDRLAHMRNEFKGRPQFALNIIEAVVHQSGAKGLWLSVLMIIEQAKSKGENYVLICEDDHQFTGNFNEVEFEKFLIETDQKKGDILLGGVHWFNSTFEVGEKLFWVDKFTATQFLVIYSRFFDTLLKSDFLDTDDLDLKISTLTDHKFVIYPFISVQKEFGYSDIRFNSHEALPMNTDFKLTSSLLNHLQKIDKYFRNCPIEVDDNFGNLSIPVFSISNRSASDAIAKQFDNKPEFNIISIKKHAENENKNLWKSHCEIINLAIEKEYDLIIIVTEEHRFSKDYSFNFLVKNILEAFEHGADALFGGGLDFGLGVPISKNRIWVNQIVSTGFVVLFKDIFPKILEYDIYSNEHYELSNVAKNKMTIYPAISINEIFHTNSADETASESQLLITNMFSRTTERLQKMSEAFQRYRS